jgi:hypothetical protein
VTATALGALAVVAAVLAIGMVPLGGTWLPRLGPHPDRSALADAGWSFGFARWELVRALAMIGGIVIARMAGITPLIGLVAGLIPAVVIRVRAQAARDRARGSVAQLLLSAHALLR